MKRLAVFILFIIPTISFGQYKYGFLQETFFGRQPSARAEAMGRGYSSIDGDLTSIFYNPAGIATINGLEIDGSFSSPYYLAKYAKYNFTSIGYRFNDYVIIALSRNNFTLGQEITYTDINGNSLGTATPKNSNYTLTFSSQPIKNLFLGLSTNYFIWQPINKSATAIYFDFGVIKKIDFLQKDGFNHSINIGASITNVNYSKATIEFNGNTGTENFPVITRYGANYQFILNKGFLIDTLKTFKFLLQGDYKMLLNSQYHSGIHTGAEFKFLEILSVRVGYYKEKQYDYDIPTSNKNEISAITYGFGLQLPIDKLTQIPLNINFDYTSLPQPTYSVNRVIWDNFTTYNLRLNWIFKKNNNP